MTTTLLLIGGLLALMIGGDALVRGASGLALRLGLPAFVVGLTIVGFGTSVPELLVSLSAALDGRPGIAIGNVIGSNIANILLILGVAAVIAPVTARLAEVRNDLAWMLAASLALPAALWSGFVGRIEGAAMVAALLLYLVLALRRGATAEAEDLPAPPLWQAVLYAGAGLVAVVLGADWLVRGASDIARTFGVSEAMIGLSVVAVGTSLPELAATLTAAIKGQRDIALGNVIGSNIFNVLGILGVTALVAPIPRDERFLTLDAPVAIAAALILAGLLVWRGALSWLVGLAFLIAYGGYIAIGASL